MVAVSLKKARRTTISEIASKRTGVVFTFEQSKYEIALQKLITAYANRIKFSPGVKTMITLDIGSTNERQILNDVTEFLKQLSK